MKKLSLTLLTVATLVFTVNATTLFDDTYTVSGGGDANFEYNAGRQTGTAAPILYDVVNGPITVTNAGQNAGKLNVLSGSGNLSYWNIASHNFTESSDFSVECEVERLDGADNFHWFSINIGTDGGWSFPSDAGASGLEIRFWEQGQLVVYLNSSTPIINQAFDELKVSVNPTIKIRLVVSQPDFAGSGDGKIALFVNDKALPLAASASGYTLVNSGGFTNNYINFRVGEANINFDNLKVMTAADNAITTAAWTGDGDSGINSTKVYTHAVNLADTAAVVVNGQTFTAGGATTMSGANWELRTPNGSTLNQFTGRATSVTPTSGDLLPNFFYPSAGAPSLTLTGLTPAQQYILTLYSMGFEGIGGRESYIATSDGAVIANVDQDEFNIGNGQLLTYQYTANADGVFSISTTPVGAAAWHSYAFSNEEVIPEPALIGFILLGELALLKRKF